MRIKKGIVLKTIQDRTITVVVHTYKNHPKYHKRFRISKKYHVHNPENQKFEIGSEVTFYETKPISKLKKWTLIKPTTK